MRCTLGFIAAAVTTAAASVLPYFGPRQMPFNPAFDSALSSSSSSRSTWYSCDEPLKPSTDLLLSTPRLPLGSLSPPGDLPSNETLPVTAGAFEEWDFDMILLENQTEFFFSWRSDARPRKNVATSLVSEAEEEYDVVSTFQMRYALPNGTVFSRSLEEELVYEPSGVRKISIGNNRFTWTPDRKFYVVEIDIDGFRARLFYENVLDAAPFSAQPNDPTYTLLPGVHFVAPAPRSHVDGWVEVGGERWVLQNIGFHSHRWGTVTDENANWHWSLARAYSWTISMLALTVGEGKAADDHTTVYLSHLHDPLMHVRDEDTKRVELAFLPAHKDADEEEAEGGLELRYNGVCGERALFSFPALYNIERDIPAGPPQSSSGGKYLKSRTKLNLVGGWHGEKKSPKDGKGEEIAFGLGYTERHNSPY